MIIVLPLSSGILHKSQEAHKWKIYGFSKHAKYGLALWSSITLFLPDMFCKLVLNHITLCVILLQ